MQAAIGIDELKTKLKNTWQAGDFDRIARTYAAGAVEFIERLGISKGMKMLDVACGSGNLSFPAARAGADVTGVDIAVNLLETARRRAANQGVSIRFDEGDAEGLPYEDGSFDAVVSMFGAMFAPRPGMVAGELLRVCRPGGTIAMANWTPSSFIGSMFRITAGHVPPPAGMPSPLLWGDEKTVRERFGEGAAMIELIPRSIEFRLPASPAGMVDHFRMWYGPTNKAFAALDETGREALRADLTKLWEEHNRATDGTTRVSSEYLEVRVSRA